MIYLALLFWLIFGVGTYLAIIDQEGGNIVVRYFFLLVCIVGWPAALAILIFSDKSAVTGTAKEA